MNTLFILATKWLLSKKSSLDWRETVSKPSKRFDSSCPLSERSWPSISVTASQSHLADLERDVIGSADLLRLSVAFHFVNCFLIFSLPVRGHTAIICMDWFSWFASNLHKLICSLLVVICFVGLPRSEPARICDWFELRVEKRKWSDEQTCHSWAGNYVWSEVSL